MISGDSLLLYLHSSNTYEPITLGLLVRKMLGIYARKHKFSLRTQCVVAEDRVYNNQIVRGHVYGELPVQRIVTERSRAISATHDHLFSTPDGYKRLAELSVGESVFVAPWPRKFGHLTPGVVRDESWHKWPTAPVPERIEHIIDVGFHNVFDLDMEFPFNNYAANEFVVSSG